MVPKQNKKRAKNNNCKQQRGERKNTLRLHKKSWILLTYGSQSVKREEQNNNNKNEANESKWLGNQHGFIESGRNSRLKHTSDFFLTCSR